MTDLIPMQLEKYNTCYIERRLHIPYNPASARLTTGLLMFNALIQLKIIGRAKRAPLWGVQSRFHVIYIYMYIYMYGGMSRMSN